MKNSYNQKIVSLKKKNFFKEIYFDWIKMFWYPGKKWNNENVFYLIKIYFNWIKMYFGIMKKSDILLNTNLIWLKKILFWHQ